ncbi:MAG TPA: hypothetical protein VNI58_07520 [Mariprofundaceae bacterium]|nr:hypothetical protein [Mariprofundaceae bacterium]
MNESALQNLIDDADALRQLIGRRVRYHEMECEVTDLLFEDGLMIMSACHEVETQEDSYGRPSRLVPQHHNFRFRDAQGHPSPVWGEIIFLDGPLES